MPHRNLSDITLFEFIVTTLIAIWSILSSFMTRKWSENSSWKVKLYFFFQDFIISGGTTYLVAMLCLGYGMNEMIALSLAGFAGHKATRFMYLVELAVKEKLGIKEKDKNAS